MAETVDHDEFSRIDHKDAILALPEAVDENGRQLYYGLEFCKKNNVVTVWDENSKGWIRANGCRYRVMQTGTDVKGPFPGLVSGKG